MTKRRLGGEIVWLCPSLDDAGNGTTVVNALFGSVSATLTNMDASTDWVAETSNGGVRLLDFDGVNDYLAATLSSGLSSSFTFSCWVRVRSASGFSVRPWITSQVASYGNYWASLGTYGNRFSFGLFDGSNNPITGDPNMSVGGIVTLNQWYHVAGVRNTVTDTISLFINGVLDRSVTDTTTSTPTYSALTIGGQTTPASRYADCQLDDIRVFHRALTQTEIAYLATQRGVEPPLVTGIGGEVAWWCPSLDTIGYGTLLVRDLSGFGNSATLTNMDAATDWVADTTNSGVFALDFDGTNDWGNAGNSTSMSFAPNSAFSISGWVWLRSLPGNGIYGLVGKGQYNNNLEYNLYIGEASNRVRFTLGDGVTKTTYLGRSTDPIASTNWAHYCAVYDGSASASGMSIWINGVKSDTANYSGGTYVSMATQNANVSLGALNFGSAFFLNGRLDDTRIFNRALSASEIAFLASRRAYQPTSSRRRRYAGAYGL